MKRIGVFFGTVTGNTRKVANYISSEFGDAATAVDVATRDAIDANDYDLLILGTSTWHIGEIDEWEEFLDQLGPLATTNTKFALFGLGDQEDYPDRFVDSMGALYDRLRARGATVIGATSAADYRFRASTATANGQFVGLALDDENQPDKTLPRVRKWVQDLAKNL